MRTIKLLSMEMEGFRSFRNRTLISFSSGPGFKFISGDNKAEPRLGPNGAGKSTLWDAFVYCLTGASVKGVRASNLLSWGENKTIWVRTDLEIEGELVSVTRQGLPDRLSINDQPAAQPAVDGLIGLSRGRLLQSVIFGQAVPLFMDLPGPERGLLLDEVLDLGIWLRAAELAGVKHSAAADDLAILTKDIAYLKGQLEGMEHPDDLEADINAWENEQQERIDDAIRLVEEAEQSLVDLQADLDANASKPIPSLKRLREQIAIHQEAKEKRLSEYVALTLDLDRCNKSMDFYLTNIKCPECDQPIHEHHAANKVVDLGSTLDHLKRSIKGKLAQQEVVSKTLDDLHAEMKTTQRKRESLLVHKASKVHAVEEQERKIEALTSTVDKLARAKNPHAERADKLTEARDALLADLHDANRKQRRGRAVMARLEFWRAGFRRVRLFMVKRVLAQLEVETVSAAAGLGLIGWGIEFSTELETKSGTTRPGIHVMINSPMSNRAVPWEAWSGGEGQRIRLAVSLGLASMIQRMAGVNFALEIWDEPTAFLGAEGIDDLMEALAHRARIHKKSVWLTDHRALSQSAFDEVWQVCKTDKGSLVTKVMEA